MKAVPTIQPSQVARLLVLVLMVCLWVAPAMADKAKKPAGSALSAAKPNTNGIVIGNPLHAVMEATLQALGQSPKFLPRPVTPAGPRAEAARTQLLNRDGDTARRDNRIVYARAHNDVFTVKMELLNDEAAIDVGIYNMLGKKVHDIYRGSASRGPSEYTAPVSDLPEGVYICVVQGTDFRRAEKFYLSR